MEILMQMRKVIQSFDAQKARGISGAAAPSFSVILGRSIGSMMQ